jgi:hypothetical protein
VGVLSVSGGLLVRRGYGGVSDVARERGEVGILPRRSPGTPLPSLSLINTLTSCLDGEEGVGTGVVGSGLSRVRQSLQEDQNLEK